MSKTNGKAPKLQVCVQHTKPVDQGGLGKSVNASRFPFDKFSKLNTGKFRTICKVCQSRVSGVWTKANAEYRKLLQLSYQLEKRGVAVRIPKKKLYKAGDVLRYTNGSAINLPKLRAKLRAERLAAKQEAVTV